MLIQWMHQYSHALRNACRGKLEAIVQSLSALAPIVSWVHGHLHSQPEWMRDKCLVIRSGMI